MPTASIICSPAFATSTASTATKYYTHTFQKGIVTNSNHPYKNSSYVAFSPGVVNYNNKTIYNSIAPEYNGFSGISNSSACTINNITVSFFGGLPTTGNPNVPENFKILCYNSAGTKKIEFSVPGAPTNTSTIDRTTISKTSAQITRIITGTFNSSNFLNQDNFYKIEFYVPQNTSNNSAFILRGNYNGSDYKLTITIDYTEPPKPSFTNAPVLKVNNNTISSVDNTAVLTWTQASLDSNFSNLQSSVKYEIWVNDGKYSDAGTNLTFTYLEQSTRKVIKVRAYIVSSGVTYYSNYSNGVYYTYIPSGYVATKVINDGQAYDPNWTGETDPGSQSIIYNFSSGETLWVNPKSDLEGGYSIYHLAYNIWGKVGYVSLAYLDWALNTLKYYDNGWKDCYIYYYNGSNWIPCMAYYYTGTEWKQCY